MESHKLLELIDSVTERYEEPIKIGKNCLSNVFYRVEDLSPHELYSIANYLITRIEDVCYPDYPTGLVVMPGDKTGIAEYVATALEQEYGHIEIISFDDFDQPRVASKLKSRKFALVTDVITTAKSCLEAHTQATIQGGEVVCWISIIDRTFGPGPVPVVAGATGEGVELL